MDALLLSCYFLSWEETFGLNYVGASDGLTGSGLFNFQLDIEKSFQVSTFS